MIITVRRDSNIFPPDVTDELNNAFYKINKQIESYNPPELEYKEDIQSISMKSNSFRSGNLLCIRETLQIDKGHTKFEKIGELTVSVPYEYWCTIITKEFEAIFCMIKDNSIYVYGDLTHYPQEGYLVEDIVVP